jgi:hypothetical protein
MKELLLGHRCRPRSWLLTLALGVALAKVFSWLVLLLPPIWLFGQGLPLILKTLQLLKNEEIQASGQADQVEARSYRLFLTRILQAALMSGLLLAVVLVWGPPQQSAPGFGFAWAYLIVAPLLHPRPFRKRWTHCLWLVLNGTFCLRLGVQFCLPAVAFGVAAALLEKAHLRYPGSLARRIPLAPVPTSDNPYEFRICRILSREPYSRLLPAFWLLSLVAIYGLVAWGEIEPLALLACAMGCGPLVLLGILHYKERTARCHELVPAGQEELRVGLYRPIQQLGRKYCLALALAILPLWLVFPEQNSILLRMTCQMVFVVPLSFRILSAVVFRTGQARSAASGFWLSMLTIYFLGILPGMAAETLLCLGGTPFR